MAVKSIYAFKFCVLVCILLLCTVPLTTILLALSSTITIPLNARMTDHVPGDLKITVIKAYGLPNTDGGGNTADPYAKVTAYTLDGTGITTQTNTKDGTLSPVWNQVLSFGNGQWSHFYIEIWDEDGGFRGEDDSMTDNYRVDILTPCSENPEKLGNKIEYSYYIDYSF